jgi:glycerate dehydrogenase
MKIVLLDALTLGGADIEEIAKLGQLTAYETTSKEETIERCKDAQIILTNKVVIDKEIMDNAPNLKLICVTATGMNNIDLEYAKQKGIIVKNAAGYSTNSVTQLTFSLLFTLLNHMEFYSDFGKNHWVEANIFTNLTRPFWELSGKKWGIIGLGTIGKNVAKAAEGFDCEVCYYSTSGANSNAKYKRVDLEDMLKSCDVISIHSPLNEKTKDILNESNLHLIKDRSILLNLGRGGIVNEKDICKELDKREIYFGTDVLEVEPMIENSPYLKVENRQRLCITPHIAWGSEEAREKLVKITAENIRSQIS